MIVVTDMYRAYRREAVWGILTAESRSWLPPVVHSMILVADTRQQEAACVVPIIEGS